MSDPTSLVAAVIGTDSHHITWWQMSIRAVVVLVYSIVLFRLADRRVFGKYAALDIVAAVIFGSTLSRALTGNSPFFATLVATAVLVLVHAGLARLAFQSRWFERLSKGRAVQLVREGELDADAMARSSITEQDLTEAVRARGGLRTDLADVKAAYLERGGQITVIWRED